MPIFVSRKKFETEIAKRVIEGLDQAVEQMGAELHDELHSKFSTLPRLLEMIDRSSTDPVGVKSLVNQAIGCYMICDGLLKNITRRTRPTRLESHTFINLLQKLCEDMEHPGLAHIHFTTEGEAVPVALAVEEHLLRIVRELIQNALKHSAAWHIWVRLRWEPEVLTIEVEDDGSGFERLQGVIDSLRKKNNTLKMRTQTIGASIDYEHGQKGLRAKVTLHTR